MIPDAANPLSSPEFIHPGGSGSEAKKATLVPWLVRNTCSFIKSWFITPPPLTADAALADYKNMTKGIPGAKSFNSETGLLVHIQAKLLNFEQQTSAITSQPGTPSPPVLAIQGINAIRLAPRQGIKPVLHLVDQWACVPLLGRSSVDSAGCRPVTLAGVIAQCHDIVSDAISRHTA